MEKYSYHREQLTILSQFSAAFDGAFLYRYTKDNVAKEKINVRYVFGPKNRVLYDIVSQAKNITLPVIAMEQQNIKRDSARIQFKDQKITRPNINDRNISRVPSPVPVICDIAVSFIANYKEDIDQIVSNFIPWCNPYFIISWKVPEEFGMDFVDELRTEVSWSGSVDFENPTNITSQDKYKIVGNTSFTVKGWIFPALETPQAPIYTVNTNFISVSSGSDLYGYNSYPLLSANDTTDHISVSAYPEFTNIFYGQYPIFDTVQIPAEQNATFTFLGKRFNYNNSWYLSADNIVPGLNYEQVTTARFPIISAYRIPDEWISVFSGNSAAINLSSSCLSGFNQFTFITSNEAGWATPEPIFFLDNKLYYHYVQPNLHFTYLRPDGIYTYFRPDS